MAMMSQEFSEYFDAAQIELREKQARIGSEFGLEGYTKFVVDYTAGTLTFLDDDTPKVEALIVPIATQLPASNRLVWAWASDQLPPAASAIASRLQELGEMSGLDIFTNPTDSCDEAGAWEIAALACKYLDAMSANRIPHGDVHSYVLITSIRALD